jgi:hypothetical protein
MRPPDALHADEMGSAIGWTLVRGAEQHRSTTLSRPSVEPTRRAHRGLITVVVEY